MKHSEPLGKDDSVSLDLTVITSQICVAKLTLCSQSFHVKCEYKATMKRSLKLQIESKHANITYPCAQWGFKTTWNECLKWHIYSIDENVS